MRAWCLAHKFLLVSTVVSVSVGYMVLALVNDELAKTIGIGYACVVVTLVLLLHLPRRSKVARGSARGG